ncbi:MAG: hypothetical protein IPK98_09830 [Chloracidobacterium sp.]|nr:hypothetical protein [Chloracidobacterium sp.]
MNYRLLIQYDGTDFHGWQVQENDRSIQGELERVIGMLVDQDVSVVGSGRTDAGVHAEGQVANVKLPDGKFTPEKLKHAINGNLWRDIRILKVEKVPDEFHARFSAKQKTYVYRVVNAPGDVAVLAAVRSSRNASARRRADERNGKAFSWQARLDGVFGRQSRRRQPRP